MIELALPAPQTTGEWLALAAAILTILLGLLPFLLPRRALGLQSHDPEFVGPAAAGVARSRSGGFLVGMGLAAILLNQPFIWLALGGAWFLAALGRLLSVLFDRGARTANAAWLVAELALAFFSLSAVLGIVA